MALSAFFYNLEHYRVHASAGALAVYTHVTESQLDDLSTSYATIFLESCTKVAQSEKAK